MDGQARNQDAAGNTTSIGGKAFAYNDANRMSAVKQGAAVVESYGYNHRGERVLRAPASGDAQVTVYDEAGQWVGNYSSTGQAQQQAIWLDNYPVALIQTPATGVPELAYIQPDHLGTPRVVIDPVRDVALWEWSNKSEVFGDQAPANDPDGDGVAFDPALRFPGQQATDASGLFYNYQREYEPGVGRYSQSDPIGLEGGINSYAYAKSNASSLIDPHGLQSSIIRTIGPPPPGYYGGEDGAHQQYNPDLPNYGKGESPGLYIYPERISGELLANALAMMSKARLDLVFPWLMMNQGKDGAACPTPGQRGLPGNAEPNTWSDHPTGKQSRYYGDDGRPKFDIDRGHDHGQGNPHVHEWESGVRKPGVPVSDWPKR